MAKVRINVTAEEDLVNKARKKKINRSEVFEEALAEKLGYKIERGTKLVKIKELV